VGVVSGFREERRQDGGALRGAIRGESDSGGAAGVGFFELGISKNALSLQPLSVKDFHARILHAVGLRNDDLFFEHNGGPERLTGVAGSGKEVRGVFG
jgi:hypothetical protein